MHDRETGKILVIGDVSKAFLDPGITTEGNCEICPDISRAAKVASEKDFAAIAVVMHGISARLGSALKALRKACDTRIVLLAQMYEEPIAIRLLGSRYNGTTLANDYLICPVRPQSLCESVVAGPNGRAAPVETIPILEASTEMRIRHLEKLATEDDLTGLKNRRYVWEFSRQIIERATRRNGRVTLLVFDIDDFKRYNDLYGHAAGDGILRQAAVLIERCCRAHDVVGRIGGDEFAVVFWDDPRQETTGLAADGTDRRSSTADHPKQAISIAKRLVRELETAKLSTSGDLGPRGKGILTISGGLASFPRDGGTIQELFEQADKALLEAKRSGKNRIYLVGTPKTNVAEADKARPNA